MLDKYILVVCHEKCPTCATKQSPGSESHSQMTAAVASARQDPVVHRPGINKGTWPSLGIWQKVPWRKCLLNGRAGIQEMEAESRKHEQKSRKKGLCAGSLVWKHREGRCWGSGEREKRQEGGHKGRCRTQLFTRRILPPTLHETFPTNNTTNHWQT